MELKNTEAVFTWQQFKEMVGRLNNVSANLYYRGQSASDWPLKTSFHRLSEKTGITLPQFLDLVNDHICYYVSSRLNKKIKLDDQYEYASFLALLQHHGFPTPLLDWTESPYVAAYFAFRECRNIPDCKKVKVYAFDQALWQKHHQKPPTELRQPDPYILWVRPFAWDNPRQLVQRSIYSATNVFDLEKYLNELLSVNKEQQYLYVTQLSIESKEEALKELDMMNINEMTLFPDLDGLCRTLRTKYGFDIS